MPAGIGYANDLELSAIDSMLGDEDDPRRRPRLDVSPSGPNLTAPPPVLTREMPTPDISFAPDPSGAQQPGDRGPALTPPSVTPPASAASAPPPSDTPPTNPTTAPPTPVTPPAPPTPGTTTTSGDTSRTASNAGNRKDAYNNFVKSVSPNASRAEMEAAIEAAYSGVPGYGGAYKESVMIDGKWYDLVGGYGGPSASFHGMMAKTGGGGAGAGFMEMGGTSSALQGLTDESRLDAILASIDAMARGENSPLVPQAIDTLLAQASPPPVVPGPAPARRVGDVRNATP